ncbi:MAG: site-specific DNA-methyltransferase [Anaerolineales bacterium]|nr:site-specific DNA-methyltransferase [Anaerolineales bacterium]
MPPLLTWDTKSQPPPIQGQIKTESLVFPKGVDYTPLAATDFASNRLILGDNLAVMSALLPQYEESIPLIYADPPFFSNRRYPARIGRGEDSRKPKEWQLAEGYADHWEDIDAYLDMLYPRLVLMHRLLSPTGTFYLHLDWHANAYARLLLDEIFGAEQFLNEIIWVYHGPSPIRSAFNRKHDTILVYTKSEKYTFNVDAVRQPYDPTTIKTFASSKKAGFGKIPDLARGKVPEDWWYFPVVARLHNERTGYPTQKPLALMERIILASSNTGDAVADFFCGSGTTASAAMKLGRNFITSDVTWRAIHTTKKRLLSENCAPFVYQIFKSGENTAINNPPTQTASPELSAMIRLVNETIEIDPTLLPSLDFWEAGIYTPDQIYHSVAQAVRPLKKKTAPDRLSIPWELAKQPLWIRLTQIDDEQVQLKLD